MLFGRYVYVLSVIRRELKVRPMAINPVNTPQFVWILIFNKNTYTDEMSFPFLHDFRP